MHKNPSLQMLRDKQSDRADEHLPNNKTPGKIWKKNQIAILILLAIFPFNIIIM